MKLVRLVTVALANTTEPANLRYLFIVAPLFRYEAESNVEHVL